jgi:hypothetical protein
MPKSSIDHLLDRVDWRCAKCDTPIRVGCDCWDRISPDEKRRVAEDVRLYVREYVRQMYPDVHKAMTPHQRTSIYNAVYNAVHTALGTLNPPGRTWPGDHDE